MTIEVLLKLVDRYLIGGTSLEEAGISVSYFEHFQDCDERWGAVGGLRLANRITRTTTKKNYSIRWYRAPPIWRQLVAVILTTFPIVFLTHYFSRSSGLPVVSENQNKSIRTLQWGQTDLEAAIAWKEGYFVLKNEDIESILVKPSRLYQDDIEDQGELSDKRFTIISPRGNLSALLAILESTRTIHFKILGRGVMIMT